MKKKTAKQNDLQPDQCPVKEFPCPRGAEIASECQLCYDADFNPMLNFHDFDLLQCAAERARELHQDQGD